MLCRTNSRFWFQFWALSVWPQNVPGFRLGALTESVAEVVVGSGWMFWFQFWALSVSWSSNRARFLTQCYSGLTVWQLSEVVVGSVWGQHGCSDLSSEHWVSSKLKTRFLTQCFDWQLAEVLVGSKWGQCRCSDFSSEHWVSSKLKTRFLTRCFDWQLAEVLVGSKRGQCGCSESVLSTECFFFFFDIGDILRES